jgi:predicted permease
LSFEGGRRSFGIEGYAPAEGEDMEVHFSVVGPGYFETVKTPIARGRALSATDAKGRGAVVVNQAFVNRYWPGKSGLGERIVAHRSVDGRSVETPMEVAGVAQNGKYVSLGEEARPFIFYPQSHLYEAQMNVLLRTSGDPARLAAEVRSAVASLDPNLPLFDFKTLEQHLGLALFPVRAVAWLLGLMGALALFLAVLGLHGVLSYSVSRRTREIGIRMAIGAQRDAVLRMILGFGARLTTAGLALGLLAALGVTRFLTFLLYGISPLDPLTFVLVPGLLLAVSLGAAALPARRAAAVEPVEALREE